MSANVFESFNAKNLAPFQVAKTFIPPSQFGLLCGRSHAVVIGPRGSGKTTLLKMLQLPSLLRWRHAAAESYREQIDFVAVFIGADIVWREQMLSLAAGELPEAARTRMAIATFTTHVFISLVNAFEDASDNAVREDHQLSKLSVSITPENEAKLIRVLSSVWKISPDLPSFLGLKIALRQRLAMISDWSEQFRHLNGEQIDEKFSQNDWAFLSFYENCLTAIEAINGLSGKPDLKWALLFDELEIAPDPIRKRLLTLLRGTDTRILLKLSISPYNSDFSTLAQETGAKPGNDYIPIALWYSEKEEALPFAEELTASILAESGVVDVRSQTVFGTSDFDLGREEQQQLGSAYAPGSSNFRRFSDLAVRDTSFQDYLAKHRVDLKRMHVIDDAQRAAHLRKITSVVTVREAYFRQAGNEPGQRIRSRKRPRTFTGASALFAVTEGNPRWIIGTLGPLLKKYAATHRTVKREEQIKTILVAVERFRALLGTVPLPDADNNQGRRSLLSLVDEIGKRFHRNVVLAPFSPEPATTFRVGETVPQGVMDALQVALNVGAIVFIPDNPGEAIIEDLRGKRFRLTYLLAPYYRLPPTIGKERQLATLLQEIDIALLNPDLFSDLP